MTEQVAASAADGGLAARLAAIPANRWTKCPHCGVLLYYKQFEHNLKVCPECAYHFRSRVASYSSS